MRDSRRANRNWLAFVVGLGLFTTLLIKPSMMAAQEQSNSPVVMPPHSVVAAKTLQEWSAIWWKWAYAIPATDNPLLELNGDKSKFGDVGPVFFLAGLFVPAGKPFPPSVTRSVTIPAGKFIFFPVLNVVDDNVGNGCTTPTTTPCLGRLTIDQLFTQLEGFLNVTALHASIDGNPVDDLFKHHETAPAFNYTYQLTDNLAEVVFGYAGPDAAGTVFPAVADGYYLMLRPLSAGQHTIRFGGTNFGSSLDVTYNVTVTPTPSPQPALLIP
jgi:hypothetical protein